jgi:hypothetical protein
VTRADLVVDGEGGANDLIGDVGAWGILDERQVGSFAL